MIKVYSKPGCGKCDSLKEKLDRLGVEYEEHTLEYHITAQPGWQDRNDRDLLVWCCQQGLPAEQLPTVEIDGEYYAYAGAIKVLKRKGVSEL